MDCRNVFERLSADLDGELSTTEADLVRRHVMSCADCARKRTQLGQTRRAFRSIALEPASPGFDADVLRRVQTRSRRTWWLSAAAGLAAALAFLLLRHTAQPVLVMATPPRATPSLTSRVSAPRGSDAPGWSDGRVDAAADCALSKAIVCLVETPCADRQCSPAATVDLAPLNGADITFAAMR